MNRKPLLLGIIGLSVLLCSAAVWAQCPQDPADNGICDTIYVEVHPDDTFFGGGVDQVRVPIRVTHDVPNPVIDSVAGFTIPLCYTSSNPDANATLDPWYNTTELCFWSDRASIFRPLAEEPNWMAELCSLEPYGTRIWHTIVLNIEDQHFWLVMVNTGLPLAPEFGDGSRVLVATATFSLEDTTTVCIDSCFWPPSTRLMFCRSDAVTYFPRDNLPYCFSTSPAQAGDLNADGVIDLEDLVFLVNYLFKDGPPPSPCENGELTCDEEITLADVIALVNYLYKGIDLPDCS